jgi:predicted secreted protein
VTKSGRALLRILLAVSSSLLLAAGGCVRRDKAVLTDEDDGASIELLQDSHLYIELDANPESNFLWVIDHLDQNILEFESKRLVTTEEQNRFGGHVHREFRFKAKRTGETRLVLQFISTDDDDAVASDEYRLKVKVIK